MALLAIVLLGCASGGVRHYLSPESGYEPLGTPQRSYEEARTLCRSDAEFRSQNGTTWTDWNRFAGCMEREGWVRN